MSTPQRPRRSLAEVYLFATGAATLVYALLLLLAPARLTTGPALKVLFDLQPRSHWGLVFLVLSAVAVVGAIRPTAERFVLVLSAEVSFQVVWGVGLTLPAFSGHDANLLAVVPWLQLALTAALFFLAGRQPRALLPPNRPKSSGRR